MKIKVNELVSRVVILTMLSPVAFAADNAVSAPVAVHPMNLVLGLIFLTVIVVAGWWLVQRMGGLQIKAGSAMRIITAMSVGPRERVVLIDIAGEQMLLGVAPGRVNLLHRFEQPIITPSTDDFASKIRHVMQQGLNK